MVRVSWPQALAWRMRQQLLDPLGSESVPGTVHRLVAVPAQFEATAELAVRVRRVAHEVLEFAGLVASALEAGEIVTLDPQLGRSEVAAEVLDPMGRCRQ